MNFNIKQDLEGRNLKEQVEIMWISGPTFHNVSMIAFILKSSEAKIFKIVKDGFRRDKKGVYL